MDKSHVQVDKAGELQEGSLWLGGYLGFIIIQSSENDERNTHTLSIMCLLFTIWNNICTHNTTHKQLTPYHTTHTFASNKARDPKAGHSVTANQIYFWEKKRKLCCCRQLCHATAPWCPGVYALSASSTQITGWFSMAYSFLYCHNQQ